MNYMKMYFYYGVMGSSKTASALMKKFSFEEHNRKVALIKPGIDSRDGKTIIKSRMGLACQAITMGQHENIIGKLNSIGDFDIIIADESQFFTKKQINDLRELVDKGIMVMCYGLKTDYMGNLFEGSKRLLEVSDTIREIQTMCLCGRKAIINARYSGEKIVYAGDQIDLGGDDKYVALCHQCWKKGKI